MGILDDTLNDALQPLPTPGVVRRSTDADIAAEGLAPESADLPADGALTVYRLQKDGGSKPPAAPSGPHPAHDGPRRGDPRAAAAVKIHDASLPLAHSRIGLETGEGQATKRQSDVADTFASSVFPDSVSPSSDAMSTGVRSRPDRVPQTNESARMQVQRESSHGNWRRATGRGAASGEPADAATAPAEGLRPAAPTGGPVEARPARAVAVPEAPASPSAATAAVEPAATPAVQPASAHQNPSAGPVSARTATAAGDPARLRPQAPAGSPVTPAVPDAPTAAPGTTGARAPRPAEGQRLSIGRIEVVVLAPAAPPARPASGPPEGAFLSRHYLRRL